jgi:hypothetical protein
MSPLPRGRNASGHPQTSGTTTQFQNGASTVPKPDSSIVTGVNPIPAQENPIDRQFTRSSKTLLIFDAAARSAKTIRSPWNARQRESVSNLFSPNLFDASL